ncbi:VIT1/CCC1 transporter family protein [Lacticaseibacillus songhuajiangensis]|jgi:VIT1/CCC1 family predicted Fe2+/Mn2+ transporter|uniref:VIT1/CCC1 transporter family protein n=1 Tax=Lacticaseibacillus songhuajiangensis TaxID=1296539 RepID=UPI000F7A7FEE|nr:VIT family protein [Lacticaseibacillus songhuajiangensis]
MSSEKKSSLNLAEQINLIRAGVMGANDGILSVAAIVLGVAAATNNVATILLAGMAGMLAGTISMAMGEYVSVHAQRDAEKRAVADETVRLHVNPDAEQQFVEDKYVATGISRELAHKATAEMFAVSPLNTAVRERYNIDPTKSTSAVGAAIISMLSFPLGSALPMLMISFAPNRLKIPLTIVAVIIALAITGAAAARLGNAKIGRATLRNIVAGLITMAVTYGVGHLFAR